MIDIRDLLSQELERRKNKEINYSSKEKEIIFLIQNRCSPQGKISRGLFQDFCFREVTGKETQADTSFRSWLNDFLPSLGFPLKRQHNNVAVYSGISFKDCSSS